MEYRWVNNQLGEQGPLCKKDPGYQYEFCGYQLRDPQIIHVKDYDTFFENPNIHIVDELGEEISWSWLKNQAKVLTHQANRIKFYRENEHIISHLEMPFYSVFWMDQEEFPFVSNRYWGV